MLSVIIPMGGEDEKGRRLRNLRETLGCIERQTFRDYEVILVEEVYDGVVIFEDMDVDKYVQVEAAKYSNVSWTRNVGAKCARGDRLLPMDGDLLFDVDYFERIMDVKRPWFIAWDTCFRLTEIGAGEFNLNEDISKLFQHRDYAHGAIHYTESGAAGFCSSFTRDFFFNKLGGYNENFTGWGGEDNDMVLRARHLLGRVFALEYTIYHQPHGDRGGGNSEFEETKKDPQGVTRKLVASNLGLLSGPTQV